MYEEVINKYKVKKKEVIVSYLSRNNLTHCIKMDSQIKITIQLWNKMKKETDKSHVIYN